MNRSTVPPVAVEYPSGAGKPMAENDVRSLAIHYAIGALRVYYEAEAARLEEAAARRKEAIARRATEARAAELEALLAKSRPA